MVETKKYIAPPPHQVGQYPNIGPGQACNIATHNVILTSREEILFQMCSCQYFIPFESTLITLDAPTLPTSPSMMIPHPNSDPTPKAP
jgi:hypothetical protein